MEKKKSVAGQFAVKYNSETYCWTQKLNGEDYGVDKLHNTVSFDGHTPEGSLQSDTIELIPWIHMFAS